MKKIRKAVGAIAKRGNTYLLIHKIKLMDESNDVAYAMWDFPKGGVKEEDIDLEKSLLRELKEETGSTDYQIIKHFEEKIRFDFPKGFKYDAQETDMFLVEYTGDFKDLKPDGEEIDAIRFFSLEEVMTIIELEETKAFLQKVFKEIL